MTDTPKENSPFTPLRIAIKGIAAIAKQSITDTKNTDVSRVADRREVLANLRLAYRHLEDASMRIGKAIRASDGGVSVYDRATTVGA